MSFLGIILIILAVGAGLLGLAAQKRFGRLRRVMSGLFVSYLSVVLLLAVGEVYFHYFHAESGWSFTLAFQNWYNRYMHLNALGFRDREWTPEDYTGRRTVLVVGDSFSVGWGVEDVEQRYSNSLARLLGDDYAVINIAVGGATTRQQLEILRNYPLQTPDIVLWQYYLNDIDDAALSIGDRWFPTLPVDTPLWVQESYMANFFYWRLVPVFTPVDASDGLTYWQWAYRTYDNSGIWEIHQQEINDLVAYIDGMGARLIVVIFPNLQDPVGSIAYVDRVAQAIRATGHDEILTLYDDVAALGSANIIVSRRDAHPNALFHQHVAQRIYETFFAGQP
ncbi:MAG: SGNH/GDSL hydrolase family protein [Chloroflexi bacterium]|nr:SGNH/GDSL hydrolase family protein [Chloroflexota bacterium]